VKLLSDASYRQAALFVALVLIAGLTFAGQTGKIAGRILDGQNREPLPGASVVIEGSRLGAAANVDGYYFINNVPPGTYTLNVGLVGYQKAVVKNVQVKIDLTTAIDVKLNSTAVDVSEVVITAERPLVQKDLTSSSVTVSSDEIRLMPVDNVDQVINLQAGVIGGHFRGGRTNEVLYLVDGVSVTDPYNNGRGITVENSSIQQMEVISGAFNAEYGQAMSGVVNIVTQEGGNSYHGSLSGYVGDFVTSHTDVFEHLDHISVPRTRNIEGTIGGPVPEIDGLTFFLAGRYNDQEGYLYGKRVYNTSDLSPYMPTGDGAYLSMNPSRRTSGNGKLAYSFGEVKIMTSGYYEKGWNKYFSNAYKWNPDGTTNHRHSSQMYNLQITHSMSPSTFYTLKYNYNYFDYRGAVYDNPSDARYVDPDRGEPLSSYTYRWGGQDAGRYERATRSNLIQWALTSQLSKEHKLGAGLEAQFHRLYSHGYSMVNLSPGVYDSLNNPVFKLGYRNEGAIGNESYIKYPVQASAYLQDKMEYDIMIINAGARFDWFDPASSQPADLKNPDGNTLFENAGITKKASRKYQISPRLGISFPITDQGIIHFSYGHFFQMPGFDNLYTNPKYLVAAGGSLSTITGNPDLEAQRTVNYELGLQQVLFEIFALDLTAYYRDIRNYLGMQIIETYDGRSYARYINRDYANVRGIVASVEKRFSNWFSIKVDYTFQIAEGNASDPRTVYYNNQSDPPIETPKSVVALDWDQRNTLYMTLMVGDPGKWTASTIFQYGSGYPYTEDVRVSHGITFLNSAVKPATYNVDLRVDGTFQLAGLNINAFLWVYNLLDIKNEYNVNSATGRANLDIFTYQAGTIRGLNTIDQYLNDPSSFSGPREVRLGLSLEF
jgi:outer membrane receptor protein involved in Fe transport